MVTLLVTLIGVIFTFSENYIGEQLDQGESSSFLISFINLFIHVVFVYWSQLSGIVYLICTLIGKLLKIIIKRLEHNKIVKPEPNIKKM